MSKDSKGDLYTVTMVRSVRVTTPAGEKMKDIIETHYDVTWKGIGVLQVKHGGDVQLEKQTRRLDLMPNIDFGERDVSTEPKRRPPMERVAKDTGFQPQKTAWDWKKAETVEEPAPPAGYAGVVNEMLKDATA